MAARVGASVLLAHEAIFFCSVVESASEEASG